MRLVCAACSTPLLRLSRDGDDIMYEVLDKRLRGSAVQFQADRDDPDRVHKVIVVCQEKHCTGTPQFTTQKMIAAIDTTRHEVDLRL